MRDTVGPDAFTPAVGPEPEGVALIGVVGGQGHVPRVGTRRGTRPPEQVAPDAALVRHQRHTEIGTEVAELGRGLDPALGRDEVVALRQRRKLVGVIVGRDGRSVLGRSRHGDAMLARLKVKDLGTPALVVDRAALEHNLAAMADALPGPRCRPHVKAHKTTALAREQAARGHRNFTCATVREMEGMARAGLGDDLLLANEVVDAERLGRLAALEARITVAVDSEATVAAAADAGLSEVLVDVDVGMFRCGCRPEDAGRIADAARRQGLEVRGVMGYEGHVMGLPDRAERAAKTQAAMALLLQAHADTGGEIVSAGGTCNFDINTAATEIQAGTYALMDSAYTYPDLPFRRALSLLATVISVSDGWAVADCGLKALALDHGNPTVEAGNAWYFSDEHVTFGPDRPVHVADRIRVVPAHIDPTVAKHERMHVVDGEEVVETWAVDLRGW